MYRPMHCRLAGIEPASEGEAHSEDELRILMKQSAKSGVIDKDEIKLMDNIFDFSDMLAREVIFATYRHGLFVHAYVFGRELGDH